MNIIELVQRSRRLLIQARKPTQKEFAFIAKVTGVGMVATGIIGLVISIITGMI
ncbi:MAG: protein translocase SEC61 complex subunit gamma [Candidatus Anstonellales archaeon]